MGPSNCQIWWSCCKSTERSSNRKVPTSVFHWKGLLGLYAKFYTAEDLSVCTSLHAPTQSHNIPTPPISIDSLLLTHCGCGHSYLGDAPGLSLNRNMFKPFHSHRGSRGGLLGWYFRCVLGGALWLRVQLQSSTQLRIMASMAFLFRACFEGICTL